MNPQENPASPFAWILVRSVGLLLFLCSLISIIDRIHSYLTLLDQLNNAPGGVLFFNDYDNTLGDQLGKDLLFYGLLLAFGYYLLRHGKFVQELITMRPEPAMTPSTHTANPKVLKLGDDRPALNLVEMKDRSLFEEFHRSNSFYRTLNGQAQIAAFKAWMKTREQPKQDDQSEV